MDYHERMKQYYDRLAPECEEVQAAREEAEEGLPGLLHAISLLQSARVLDVACGPGLLTRHLGEEVTGLDQSEAMLEIAREHVLSAAFVQGDALEMPFRDGSFDRIFASFFYGLLPLPDRDRFLSEALRVADELILVESFPGMGAGQKGGRSAAFPTARDTRSTGGTSRPKLSPRNWGQDPLRRTMDRNGRRRWLIPWRIH